MTKISEFMIRVILKEPIEVPDDQVAELCNGIALSLDMGGDFEYEIQHHLRDFGVDTYYPVDQIIVWSNQDKYGND